jgi:hypothetical protein
MSTPDLPRDDRLFAPEPQRGPLRDSVPSPKRNARPLPALFAELRNVLSAMDAAMSAEGATPEFRTRVTNRLVWGQPDGPT